MIDKKYIKFVTRGLARMLVYFFTFCFKVLPYSVVAFIGNAFISLGFLLAGKHQKISKESLDIAFGDSKTPEEKDRIMRKCFSNIGKSMLETLYFHINPEYFRDKVTINGLENLDKVLERKKGVIAITAHYGNFPVMMLALAQRGYKVNVVMRYLRDEKLEKFLFDRKMKLGLNTIYVKPRRKCIMKMLEALNNNEIVFVLLDQNFGSGKGIFVDFFGKKAATATGPIVLSQRCGAALMPVFIERNKDNTHKVEFHAAYSVVNRDKEEETIHDNIQILTNIIEEKIRRNPSEWGWMHRRWKTRPQSLHENVH